MALGEKKEAEPKKIQEEEEQACLLTDLAMFTEGGVLGFEQMADMTVHVFC